MFSALVNAIRFATLYHCRSKPHALDVRIISNKPSGLQINTIECSRKHVGKHYFLFCFPVASFAFRFGCTVCKRAKAFSFSSPSHSLCLALVCRLCMRTHVATRIWAHNCAYEKCKHPIDSKCKRWIFHRTML